MIGKILKVLMMGVLTAVIAVGVALGVVAYAGKSMVEQLNAYVGQFVTQAPAASAQEPVAIHTIDTRAITVALAKLNRWETQAVKVHACTTVDNAQSGKIWSFFTEEVKSVCADGVIIAGVDMRDFAGNVTTTAGSWVHVTVPASQVFSVTVDPTTYTVDTAAGRKGWFAPERDDAMWQQITQNLRDGMLTEGCTQNVTSNAADAFREVVEKQIKAIDPAIMAVTVDVSAGDCKTIAAIDWQQEGK